jgi:hypothetical protein
MNLDTLESAFSERSEYGARQIRNANHFLYGQTQNCLSIEHCCERRQPSMSLHILSAPAVNAESIKK